MYGNHCIDKIYSQVIFCAIVIFGISVLRVFYGSLPTFLCDIFGFLRKFALMFITLTRVMYTFTRFMFVCIWKRMRQMDDNLIVRIATIEAIILSLLFNLCKLQLQGQETIPVSSFYFCCASLLDNTKLQGLKDANKLLVNINFRPVLEIC